MADPRNPSFEDVPSGAYLDPRSFVEALQEQQEQEFTNIQEDRGLLGFATLILAGVGGYAALKHFPPGRIAAVAGEIKQLLTNPKSYGASTPQLDTIRGALNKMSQVALKQPWAQANQAQLGAALGSIRAANDPEFLQGIRTIGEIARKDPKNFANVMAVQSTVKSHYRPITIGDLFDHSTSEINFKSELWGGLAMPKPLAELQNVLKDVAYQKIPGLGRMRLAPGMYVHHSPGSTAGLVDYSRWHPNNWIRGLQRTADDVSLGKWSNWPGNMSRKTAFAGAALGLYAGYDKDDPVSTVTGTLAGLALGSIPVRHLARAGRWATELLLPTELLARGPDVIRVGPGVVHKYASAQLSNVTGGIVSFGKLFPVFGTHKPQISPVAIAEGLKVGRTGTAMGRTASQAHRESFITQRLAKQGISRADEYIAEREATTEQAMNPVKALLIRLGDTIGVGPQYNRGIGNFVDPDVVPTGQPLPSMLQGLFMDPAKTMHRAVSGFFKNLSGKEAATKTGAADYYAFRPYEGLKNFANFQLNRVGHLFEQTLGFGIKFGATPGETAKRWLGISIGAMAGIEALKYTDYAMRQMIGTGPISAPLQAYAAIRNTEQHLLAATGIQQTSEYLENLMPGIATSPLSSVLRTAAVFRLLRGQAPLGFLGAKNLGKAAAETINLEARYGLKGRAAAGILAATQLTDITESPVHLAAVYRGEVDVPVREGAGWMLGTTPYGGGRVTHTRPHLIPTMLSHAREIGVFGCVAENTGILLANNEIKNVQNIEPGDKIITHSGSSAKAVALIKKPKELVPGNGRLITISVMGNYSKLSATPDHKLLVHPGVWKPAGAISKGQYLAIAKRPINMSLSYLDLKDFSVNGYFTSNYVYPKATEEHAEAYEIYEKEGLDSVRIGDPQRPSVRQAIKKQNIFRYPRYIALTREFGYFVGMYIAEGIITHQHSSKDVSAVVLCLNSKELSCAQRIDQEISRYTNNGRFIVPKGRPNNLNAYWSGRTLGEFIKDLAGTTDNKKIPEEAYKNKEFALGIIEGMIEGDGSIADIDRVSFSSTRKRLVYALRQLIISCGFGYASVQHILATTKHGRNNKEQWYLKLYGDGNHALREFYGWSIEPTHHCIRNNWFQDDAYCWVKITNITESFADYVYDIVLDHPDHSFQTDLCIVHNSEAGYWKSQLGLPVPEAWFGLRPLLFPYAPEQHSVEQGRGVAVSGGFVGLAGNLPLIGPTVNATIGELLKPTQYWQKDQWTDEGLTNTAQRLGFDSIKGQRSITDPTSLISSLQRQIDVLRDFLGMPGFMLGAVKRAVTGESDFYAPNRELETFGQATGWERAYYDMQLAGGLGATELLRRAVPHRRRETLLVNPLPNRLADQQWLPGSQSLFPLDRQFYLDLSRGDPYSRLISGEARLPGPGYEALHRLHSGIPGVYDAYDRWLVLREVAPTSQAFRHYDTLVKSWAAVASKGPNDGNPFRRSMSGIVRNVLDGDTVIVDVNGKLVTVRIEGGDAPETSHTVWENALEERGAIGINTSTRRGRKAIDPTRAAEGIEATAALSRTALGRYADVEVTDVDIYGRAVGRLKVRQGFAGTADISKQLAEAYPGYDLNALQRTQVESSRQYLRERFAPGPITEKIFRDPFADVPRNMRDLTSRSVTAVNRAIKEEGAFTLPEKVPFTLPEKVLGNIWERVSHINLPGPLNWPVNKFFAQRDALELYRRNTLMGGSFAQWETPISSYAVPWAHQTIGFFNKDYIPGRVKAQRAALAQVDALEYVRNRQFANYAASIGDTEAAAQFSDRRNRTAANVILTGNRRFAHSALSRTERGFYDYFASEQDESLRGSIIRNVSPQMGSVLQMGWGNASPGILERQRALIEGVSTSKMAMHPDITANMLKVRVSNDHAWDFHEIGMSQRDNYVTEDVFSDAFEIPGPPEHFSAFVHTKSQGIAHRIGLQNHTITTEDSLMGPAVNARISRDPRKYRHLMQNYGPASQGMRF